MKILILGGYGTFGGRLAQLLSTEERLTLLIAGRSKQKAEAFCNSLPARAQKLAVAFERNGDVEGQIRELQPDLVVDATGPFQLYGEDPYRVVKACIANAVHYMDLADGSDFVRNIRQFDEQARSKKISILSGVSSFPVLTAAVVRRLSRGLSRIDAIRGGIAPSPYAGVGLNVIRAIASYAGKRLAVRWNGGPSSAYALTETMHYTIAPPGYIPLKNTLFSLVDVPDLQILPELWPEVRSVWMGAGPVPEILHRMLIGLAWLVRLRLLPSLRPFAPLLHFVSNTVRWGEHRGGMFVLVDGCDDKGKTVERSWHLLAEGGDGPLIPSMAVEALVRRSLAGRMPPPGARPATGELELEDYETIFRSRTIYTGRREQAREIQRQFLYRRLLGDRWDSLPEPLRTLHSAPAAAGAATVEAGGNLLARLAARFFRFPEAGQDIPIQVSFQRENDAELWTRTFAGKSFSSLQSEGRGLSERLLVEQFGAFRFGFALPAEAGKLSLVLRRWSVFGLPLPLLFAPRGNSFEYVAEGRFCFHVEITHPITGLIVRYEGWLVPEE